MNVEPSPLNDLAKAILAFEDGDILEVSRWISVLDKAKPHLTQSQRAGAAEFSQWLRLCLRDGMPRDFAQEAGARLDQLQQPGGANTDVWAEHGPTFVSEAENRIARAQELILILERGPDRAALDELFRIAHTIKGEAGFLHLESVVAHTHTLEGLLDRLRLGTETWEATTGDVLLTGFDQILQLLPGASGPPSIRHSTADHQEVLRVPAQKIDSLIALVGELLVATENPTVETVSLIRKLGKGLQQEALKLRTEPLRGLFGRLRRGARDLSRDLGKSVELVVSGEDLELDRNLIANLEEPLLHLIRNALDHGVEPEAQRRETGKSVSGRLVLGASRKGNLISIVLSDDGRGLDPDKIWKKACDLGLASGSLPPDREAILGLVFRPGFSTAEALTAVSGRGVGMDVVATMVRNNRGRVRLESELGRGTQVTLTFPLSTAVVEGLVVRSHGQRYLVPIHSIEETIFLSRDAQEAIVQGSRIYSLRGAPLSIHSLEELLGGQESPAVPVWGVVVVGEKGRSLVLVDDVEAKREAVIRSLGPGFQNLKGIPAATILAGGTLALVLDLDQLTAGVSR